MYSYYSIDMFSFSKRLGEPVLWAVNFAFLFHLHDVDVHTQAVPYSYECTTIVKTPFRLDFFDY